MEEGLRLYNTLTRMKELFQPLQSPFVGMYVCGPTVYGDAHLGHARPAVTFDLIFRYLRYLGYRVRYIRNITDVGHMEEEGLGEGEDKIAKKARLEQLEPMEIAQYYSNRYHAHMTQLNVLNPSIEPQASGHIIEQIALIEKIIDAGFGYVSEGSVYFDVESYSRKHHYGKLSGRKVEDLISNTRDLEGQSEKRNPFDFALWKKARPGHIMKWPSPWSVGFPGWHLECSAMSAKYLGDHFDIHGGGMDLLFPHHESEIAQSQAANGQDPCKYWIHNNLITINGQKMGKSLNNFITLDELFSGKHELLEKSFSPMTIRFFILQAHYRGQLDFSNDALKAAEKGLKRLMDGWKSLEKITPSDASTVQVKPLQEQCLEAMNDDFNSPVLIATLFDGVRMINSLVDKKETITPEDLTLLRSTFQAFIFDLLGLVDEAPETGSGRIEQLMETIIQIRKHARERKDFATSDFIRDELARINIQIRDTKDGAEWAVTG